MNHETEARLKLYRNNKFVGYLKIEQTEVLTTIITAKYYNKLFHKSDNPIQSDSISQGIKLNKEWYFDGDEVETCAGKEYGQLHMEYDTTYLCWGVYTKNYGEVRCLDFFKSESRFREKFMLEKFPGEWMIKHVEVRDEPKEKH